MEIKGAYGRKKDIAMEKRENIEVSWREGGKEGQEERVRGMWLWFLRNFEQNHCISLVLSSLHCLEP